MLTLSCETMAAGNLYFPAIIDLNVGGQIYTTSLSTLTKCSESKLGAMFSGRLPAQQDSEGNYFIDRDGAMFRYVLGFLRSGKVLLPEKPRDLRLLLKEAEFYQIPALIETVKQQMTKSEEKHKSHTQDETEIITVFGSLSFEGTSYRFSSLSGRLCTLTDMFHIAERDAEQFQITPYANQSNQTYNERTGKMTVKNHPADVASVLQVAQLHGFKVISGPCVIDPKLDSGDSHWILSRK